MSNQPLRQLPAVHVLLTHPQLQTDHPHAQRVAAIRAELTELRQCIEQGVVPDGELTLDAIALRVRERLVRGERRGFRRVINATGIVLHTNLGRSVLAESAMHAAQSAGSGYLNLELDLETGKRSSRQAFLRELLRELTGAPSGTAVNNCAAATVIALRALASGKEVIVSRGQLIEIGGSFRIPDIMAVSGAVLREVGTTNITRLSDYETAINERTAALMLIHPSNYRLRGFTKSVPLADLVTLGRKHQLPVIDDCGSGALIDFAQFGLTGEPFIPERVQMGADLVLFSGDKLLGGPQAGVIVGRTDLVKQIECDPLMRAFRLDKMTLAALEATLKLYRDEATAMAQVPTLRMIGMTRQELRPRAEHVAAQLGGQVCEEVAYVGGGSIPDQALPGVVVALSADGIGEEELATRLRLGEPAVLARIKDGRVLLDVRTVWESQEEALVHAVRSALRQPARS